MTEKDYLRAYERTLRDLPWRQRRELVAELQAHLAEFPPDADLVARLGSPRSYAADVRAAAGLSRQRGLSAFIRARRPRNLVGAVVAVVVVGLLIAAVGWIATYQPLGFGNGVLPAGKEVPGAPGYVLTFHKGRRFDLGMEVVNYGRFTVRVLGVPAGSDAPWSAGLLMSSPHVQTGGFYPPWRRFRPFDLKPRYSVYLRLHGVQACHKPVSAQTTYTFSNFPVRYRFLWHTSTAQIPFPEGQKVVFPRGCR